MMLSFRKRLIKNDLGLLESHSSLLKFVLLFIIIATAFWFRIGAERGEEGLSPDKEFPSAPRFTAPVPSFDPSPSPVSDDGPASSVEKVDLSSASAESIETLPGVGPKLAREIVRFREERGPLRRVEDLLEVKGIGPRKLSQIEPYLRFGSDDKK
jgi:competence protein ComEA